MKIDLDDRAIESLLDRLDGSGSDDEREAVKHLRRMLGSRLPTYLLRRFRVSKKWGVRCALVFYAIGYAKESEEAVQLGLLAVKDRSKAVRYRGSMLLACSLRRDLVEALQQIAEQGPSDARADLMAAIDAVQSQNQNYFVDRVHSGKTKLNIM